MSRPVLVIGSLTVVVALVALALYGGVVGAPEPTPSPTVRPTVARTPSRTPLVTSRPSATPIDTSVRASAIVVPQRFASVALAVSGLVGDLYVREHQTVLANQLLLRLDQSAYLAAIDVAEADIVRAEAAVDRAQLQVDQLPPDATPGQTESAQAELRLAEAELALARTTLTEAQVALRQTELRSPFEGTVAAVSVELQEQAIAGQPLVTVGDLSEWVIETTDLSEIEVVRIAVGDEATITFEALPDLVLSGRVDRIQVRGTTDTGGVMFAVTIRPLEHNPDLRWNMSATVRIAPSR